MKQIKIRCEECGELKPPIDFVGAEVFADMCEECDGNLQSIFAEGKRNRPKNNIERMDREREHNLNQEKIVKLLEVKQE